MESVAHHIIGGTTKEGALRPRCRSNRVPRGLLGSLFWLGAGGLALSGGPALAQRPAQPARPAQSRSYRLTVRPQTMATGTQNPRAGEYALTSVAGAVISVPPQCEGPRRCPLLVFIRGREPTYITEAMTFVRPATDKHGIMLLMPGSLEVARIDTVMKEVLQRFAVDPARIASAGRCEGAGISLGSSNLGVFSRLVGISGWNGYATPDPQYKDKVEVLVDYGLVESGAPFGEVLALRAAGYRTTQAVQLRDHEHQLEDYEYVARWLAESWKTPDPSRRSPPAVVADPLPVLTTEAVASMAAFWTHFLREPDSIRTAARRAHLREVAVPMGAFPLSTWMVDMAAMAARYPSVAAALKAAGLTAQQHDAYRVALVSAIGAREANLSAPQEDPPLVFVTADPTSALGKNIAFLDAHPDELQALANAGTVRGAQRHSYGIWGTP